MNGISTLDGVRRELRLRWPEWTAVSLFAAVVAFAIPYHEPWADEAQAWQLARSLSLGELFRTYIRYEATPGLWHLLLWVLNRAHVGYTGMHWICGAIAVVSTSLLVFRSPFPRYLKLTLPLTFFLLFQYVVVARSYLLVPPMLFIIANCWKKSPLAVAVTLGLLANCSLHAAVISGGLAIVWLVEQLRVGGLKTPMRRCDLFICASILLVFYVFAVWTAWPPSDLASHISSIRAQRPLFLDAAIASITLPICWPMILSIPFWITVVPAFQARRRILYLLPVLLFSIFCGVVPSMFWHCGLVVPLLICLLWITWPVPEQDKLPPEILGRGALVLMAASQILWSAYAIHFDHYHDYSPDPATAQFLRPYVRAGATVAITYLDDAPAHEAGAFGVLPYFDRNFYINQPYPFYWWSSRNPSDKPLSELLLSHPDILIAQAQQAGTSGPDLRSPRATLLTNSGYRLTNVFCGTVPFRMQSWLTSCHLIYQYAGNAP